MRIRWASAAAGAGRLGALATLALGAASAADPAAHYQAQCAACHEQPADVKVPDTDALRRMSEAGLRHALLAGKMREFIGNMTRREVIALAEYLTEDQAASMPASAYCEHRAPSRMTALAGGWGLDVHNRRWQRRTAIGADTIDSLQLAWAFAVPGTATMRSQPVVTEDAVYLPSLGGELYALHPATGCIQWTYRAEAPLRTSVSLGEAGGRSALFVGDQDNVVHAVDAASGESLWTTHVGLFEASLLTGAPVPHGERLYVPISAFGVALATRPEYECCKSHGAVRALSAETGAILWTTRMAEPAQPTYVSSAGTQMWGPSGAPVWTTPAIDARRGVLYIGTGENTSSPATDMSDAIVALSLDSGDIVWRFQATENDAFNMACGIGGASCPKEQGPDFDFGASVVIAQNSEGRDLLLAGQKSGAVFALDPDRKGAVVWQQRFGTGSALGGVHWGLAADEAQVYVPISDPAGLAPGGRPGLWALRIDDGEVVWQHDAERGCTPAGRRRREPWPDCSFRFEFSAAVSIAGDLVLQGALDGRVFAFHRASGELLWEYATKSGFDTVNGIEGHGGAIDAAGVVAAGDRLFVPSGYDMFGQMPGNVLLVFEAAP